MNALNAIGSGFILVLGAALCFCFWPRGWIWEAAFILLGAALFYSGVCSLAFTSS